MVSQEEFVQAAIETDADAILVSSLYGHGEIDCQGLRENARSGINDIPLIAEVTRGREAKLRGGGGSFYENGIQQSNITRNTDRGNFRIPEGTSCPYSRTSVKLYR